MVRPFLVYASHGSWRRRRTPGLKPRPIPSFNAALKGRLFHELICPKATRTSQPPLRDPIVFQQIITAVAGDCNVLASGCTICVSLVFWELSGGLFRATQWNHHKDRNHLEQTESERYSGWVFRPRRGVAERASTVRAVAQQISFVPCCFWGVRRSRGTASSLFSLVPGWYEFRR